MTMLYGFLRTVQALTYAAALVLLFAAWRRL